MYTNKTDNALNCPIHFKCSDVDLLIHTMKICVAPLHKCEQTAHVLDLQDTPRPPIGQLNDTRRMDAEIFLSTAAAETYCVSKHCIRTPFVFNLQTCDKVVQQGKRARTNRMMASRNNNNATAPERLIGLVGNAKVYGSIADTLASANISFIKESVGKGHVRHTCSFFSQISIAIAWSPYIKTNKSWTEYSHIIEKPESVAYFYSQKPAERFTNPQWFDIPTIGFRNYSSYQAYGNEMLCDTDSCVLELIARIDRGEMDETIARVRQRAKRDTGVERNGKLLRNVLSDIVHWRQANVAASPTLTTSHSWVLPDILHPQIFYGNYSDADDDND